MMNNTPKVKTVAEILEDYTVLDNPYLAFYGSLSKIFKNKSIYQKLINFNNPNVKYPLIHYFFLLEYILFYQKRRSSIYIHPLLERIKCIMDKNNFQDWYLSIHLNSVGYFNFMDEIKPIANKIIDNLSDWTTVYNQMYYNKKELGFFEYLWEYLNPFKLNRRINTIGLCSYIPLILIGFSYSFMSYITLDGKISGLFTHKKYNPNKDDLISRFETRAAWNDIFCFGVDGKLELIEGYNTLIQEKFMKFIVRPSIDSKSQSKEMYIPIKKLCEWNPDFEKLLMFIENKEFLTYFVDKIKEAKITSVNFEENEESEKVKEIYSEYLTNINIQEVLQY